MSSISTHDDGPIEYYTDCVFDPVDHDRVMERIGGGFETEVYCTADRRYLVKLKSERGGDRTTVLHQAQLLRGRAESLIACLGPAHSIPSYYLLAQDSDGKVQVLVVQPFLEHARSLAQLRYAALSPHERGRVVLQLRTILRCSRAMYRRAGWMPDLYGLVSTSRAARKQLAAPRLWGRHLWDFLVRRNLLCSVNLLLTEAPESRVVLVDYDRVRWPALVQRLYFGLRWLLSWRDELLLGWLAVRSGALDRQDLRSIVTPSVKTTGAPSTHHG
jgi:hypothetical protein